MTEQPNQTVMNDVLKRQENYYMNWIKELYADIEELKIEKNAWESLSSFGDDDEWLTERR